MVPLEEGAVSLAAGWSAWYRDRFFQHQQEKGRCCQQRGHILQHHTEPCWLSSSAGSHKLARQPRALWKYAVCHTKAVLTMKLI